MARRSPGSTTCTSGWRRAGAALGTGVVLAGQTRTRSGSRQHELVGIGADGEVALVRPEDRRQVRDLWFALVADRGALLVAATGVLEVRDERLEPVATAPAGHPFLKTFRLLAGDGAGTLLWYSPRRHQLLVSTPEDVDPGALDRSLDRLEAAAAAHSPPAPPRRRAAPRRVERHLVDTAGFHHLMAEEQQLLQDALAGRLPDPSRAYVTVHTRVEAVLGRAAVMAPDDPVLGVAVRALAQVTTGEILWWRAYQAGAESVEVPFGDGTVTIRTSLNLGPPSPITWRKAWYAAVVAGDELCQAALAGVADSELSITGGPWRHALAWKAALLAYRTDPASALPLVAEAVGYSAERYFRSSAQFRAHAAGLAVHPVLEQVARGDADAFCAALLAALRAHQKWWGSRQNSHRPEGWIALGPLAMCRLAADRGLPIEVESSYLLPAVARGPRAGA